MRDPNFAPPPAWNEAERLAALEAYDVLDTPPEGAFDDIVRLAAQICGAPMALISLVDRDRQWFKAALGIDVAETPREIAFCDHTIRQRGVMEIHDAAADERFAANPLVTGAPGLRFYAGATLETADGLPLGTLCVADQKPRSLTAEQHEALEALARQVMAQLELRHALARQRSSDERHRRILESAIDYGIIAMDLYGVVESWNEGAHRIFGWSQAEMCGRRCDDFFTPEDRANNIPEIEMGAALTRGRGSDERWHVRKDGSRFWASGEMMPLTDQQGEPVGFLKIVRDRTEARLSQERLAAAEAAAEEQRVLLTGELTHRVKNTLALVQAIVSQSLRTAATPAEARRAIEDRLVALGRAHDILTSTSWASASISEIIRGAMEIHGSGPHRIAAHGPELQIKARPALGLSIALHELCTNAAKYGALSNDQGRVDLGWSVLGEGRDALFSLTWTEIGGPLVSPPSRRGFGSRLIEACLTGDLSGEGGIDYRPEGVVWAIRSKLLDIAED